MAGCEIPMGQVPCIDVRHLWDWSHGWLQDTYMGLVPYVILRYGTGPMRCSETPMGPVPCMTLRHLWDRSHSSHGTSKYDVDLGAN